MLVSGWSGNRGASSWLGVRIRRCIRVANLGLPLVAALSCLLTNCAYLDTDSCSNQANRSAAENRLKGCDNSFFSAKKQRDDVYNGDDSPRLWTGEAPRQGPQINPSIVNRAPGVR